MLLRRPSTPAERLVLLYTVILLFGGFGIACLYLGCTAPPEKAEEASLAQTYGWLLLAAAAGIWAAYRLVGWLIDHL